MEVRDFTVNALHIVISVLLGIGLGRVIPQRVALIAALVFLGVSFRLETQPRSDPLPEGTVKVGAATPSPTLGSGQIVPTQACANPPTAVNWFISDAPKGRSELTIDQPACSTVLVTSGTTRAPSGWGCGDNARQQCVFVNRTGPQSQRITILVDAEHVWYGITTASSDRAIANKLDAMLAPPNCDSGCHWATLGIHADGWLETEQRRTRTALTTPRTATATPTQVYVDARDQAGAATYVASSTGVHEIRITCGAYSPWPNDSSAAYWRSIVYGYVGLSPSIRWGPRWGHPEPVSADIEVGRWESTGGRNRAAMEAASLGQTSRVFLKAGDRVAFTAIDEQGHPYGDNRGGVCLEVALAGSAA